MLRTLRAYLRRLVLERGGRIRALWRILLTGLVFMVVVTALDRLLQPLDLNFPANRAAIAVALLLSIAVALAVSARWLDRRPLPEYGFRLDRRWWVDFAGGIGIGFLFHVLIVLLNGALGWLAVADVLSPGQGTEATPLVVAVAVWLLFFLATGVWEEALFRSVLIRNATEGLAGFGLSPAAAVTAAVVISMVIFGGLHLFAGLGSEDIPLWAVILQGIIAGAYFGLAYCLTGSLALPVGIHFGANFTDAVVLGGTVEPYASYPALLRLEWSVPEAWVLPKGVALPLTLFVLLATLAWVRWTRGAIRFDPSLVESATSNAESGKTDS